jgi:hypothetical protein
MKNKNILLQLIDILTLLLLFICFAGAVYIGFRHGIAGTHSFGERIAALSGDGKSAGTIRRWKLILAALLPVLILIFISTYRILKNCSDTTRKIICIAAFAVMAALQLFIAFSVSFVGNHDSYEIMDQALAIASGRQSQVDYSRIFYFQKYSNNNFFILLCVGLFKLAMLFGITAYVRFLTVINIICMDLSVLFLVWAVRITRDRTAASYILVLNVLNPLMYLYVGWTYTATMSMLPMMASLFILVLLNYKEMNPKKHLLLCIVLGFVLAVSYLIRPTAFFIAVAYLVYRFIKLISGYFSRKRLALFAAVLIVFAVSFAVLGKASKALNPDQSRDFPVAHWIMIGADDDGRAKGSHSDYTKKFKDKDQMKTGDLAKIKEIDQKRGKKATILHYLKKPILTFSDGTSEYYDRFNIINGTKASVYSALVEGKSPWILVYCQAFRIVTLLFAMAGIWSCIKKDDNLIDSLTAITLFGALLFYIVWEGKPAYSLPFIPLVIHQMLPAVEGGLVDKKIKNSRLLYIVSAAAACIVIAVQVPLLQKMRVQMVPSVMTSRFRFTCAKKISEGNELTQEFSPVNDFNRVEFPVHGKTDGYQISLLKGSETIGDVRISGSDIKDKNRLVCLDLPAQSAGDTYTIVIKNCSDKDSSLHVKASITDALELYDGKTIVNGKATKDHMLINVLRKCDPDEK